MLTSLAFTKCMEMDWDNTATRGDLARYEFRNEDVLGLGEESVEAGNRARGSEGSSTTSTLAAVPIFFRPDRGRVDICDVCRYYDEYRGLNVRSKPASGANLDNLFDQDLLGAQFRNAVEVSEESRNATRAVVKEFVCYLPVSKQG